MHEEEEEDEEDDNDDDDYDYIEDKLLSQTNKGSKSEKRSVFNNMISGELADKGGKRQKMWKRDYLRHNDFSSMNDMADQLKKFRANESGANT